MCLFQTLSLHKNILDIMVNRTLNTSPKYLILHVIQYILMFMSGKLS